MRQGKQKFTNGLTIVYAYPDETHPNIPSLIQLHFRFNDRYGQRKEANFGDALAAIGGIQEDLSELQNWIRENGLPQYFSGSTETMLLIRILKESGLVPTQSVEGGAYSFKFETTGMTTEEIFQKMNIGIDAVHNYAKGLEKRRKNRFE